MQSKIVVWKKDVEVEAKVPGYGISVTRREAVMLRHIVGECGESNQCLFPRAERANFKHRLAKALEGIEV